MLEGKHTIAVDRPAKCEECVGPEARREFGCGCSEGVPWTDTARGEGYAGQGTKRPEGARVEPYSRTCPQWFSRSPFVESVLEQLEDYREGRLGLIGNLPAPLLRYLRVADHEFLRAKNYWSEAAIPEASH